jgi:hypothetical protein
LLWGPGAGGYAAGANPGRGLPGPSEHHGHRPNYGAERPARTIAAGPPKDSGVGAWASANNTEITWSSAVVIVGMNIFLICQQFILS